MILPLATAVCLTHAVLVLLSLSEYFGPSLIPHDHRAGVPLPGRHAAPGWVVTGLLAVLLAVVVRETSRHRYEQTLHQAAVGLVLGGLTALLLDRLLDGWTTTYLGPFTIPDIALAAGLGCWLLASARRRP